MICPIPTCRSDVGGPLRMCAGHFKLVPYPIRDALNHYAKKYKGGPAHRASFARAVESVTKILASRSLTGNEAVVRLVTLPYRDD